MKDMSGKTVLLVEDDTFLANALKVRMEENGIVLILAHDGNAAIQKVKEEIPDLVVLDLMMPRMDGFEVLRELQKNEKWKEIPVVVVSNLGQQTDIDRALKLGAKEFLIKSDVSTSDILETIAKYVT